MIRRRADGEFMLAAMICGAAKFTASRPEAQKRLDLNAGNGRAEAAFKRGEARDVGASLADRIDTPITNVIDDIFRKIITLLSAFSGAVASPARHLNATRIAFLPRPRGVRT